MPNKKIVIGGIGLFFMLLLLVGVIAYVFIGNGGEVITGDAKYWYECDVEIKNPSIIAGIFFTPLLLKDAKIESINCQSTGKKCGFLFSLIDRKGTVEMWDSNRRLSGENYETSILTGKDTVTIRGCTGDNVIKIRLYDEDHNIIEEKLV